MDEIIRDKNDIKFMNKNRSYIVKKFRKQQQDNKKGGSWKLKYDNRITTGSLKDRTQELSWIKRTKDGKEKEVFLKIKGSRQVVPE